MAPEAPAHRILEASFALGASRCAAARRHPARTRSSGPKAPVPTGLPSASRVRGRATQSQALHPLARSRAQTQSRSPRRPAPAGRCPDQPACDHPRHSVRAPARSLRSLTIEFPDARQRRAGRNQGHLIKPMLPVDATTGPAAIHHENFSPRLSPY